LIFYDHVQSASSRGHTFFSLTSAASTKDDIFGTDAATRKGGLRDKDFESFISNAGKRAAR